jgi:hypothetical protein
MAHAFWPAWIPRVPRGLWFRAYEALGDTPDPRLPRLLEAPTGPLLMPRLAVSAEEVAAYGRPRREERHPSTMILQAWLVDIGGYNTPYGLTRELYGSPDRNEAAKKRVYRGVASGRRLLHEGGVLPWAVWPDGKPPAEWWKTDEFLEALGRWMQEAYDRGVGDPAEPDVDAAAVLGRLRGRLVGELRTGLFGSNPPTGLPF